MERIESNRLFKQDKMQKKNNNNNNLKLNDNPIKYLIYLFIYFLSY